MGSGIRSACAWALLLLVAALAGCRSDCDKYAALKNTATDLCKACVKNSCSRQKSAADHALDAVKADKACAEGCEPEERLDCSCMSRCLNTPAVRAAVDNMYACVVTSCKNECR